jgi:hypothetical protein
LSGAFGFGDRSIDRSDRIIDLAGLSLELRQERTVERPDQGVALLQQAVEALAHLSDAFIAVAEARSNPP